MLEPQEPLNTGELDMIQQYFKSEKEIITIKYILYM